MLAIDQREDYLYVVLATNLLILRYSIEPNVLSIDKQGARKRSMQSSRQIDRSNREDNNNINYHYHYHLEPPTYGEIRVIEGTQDHL
jgi:hypothetical protein